MSRWRAAHCALLLSACASGPAPVVPAPVVDVAPRSALAEGGAPEPDPAKKPAATRGEFPQDTPRAALASFCRAFDEKRWDVLMRFIPARHQSPELTPEKLRDAWDGRMREQMLATFAAIERALAEDAEIDEHGGRAELAYGRGTVQLVLEDGAWKVEDFE